MFPISRVFAARRGARGQLSSRAFGWNCSLRRAWNWGDTVALLRSREHIYIGARLALAAPAVIHAPVMMPLLDVLQTCRSCRFCQLYCWAYAFLPQSIDAEIASVVLIFTSQGLEPDFCVASADL